MTLRPLFAEMTLPAVLASARIGFGDAERANPQGVVVRVVLRFAQAPVATSSDELSDTLDYAAITAQIVALCGARPYRLLERLAQVLYAALRADLPATAGLWIEVAKQRAPLPELEQSARFGLGDYFVHSPVWTTDTPALAALQALP
jgi:dihydroneopterin aldolase